VQPTVSKLAKTTLAIAYSSTAGKMLSTKAVEDKLQELQPPSKKEIYEAWAAYKARA
jgi:hypothetical protein